MTSVARDRSFFAQPMRGKNTFKMQFFYPRKSCKTMKLRVDRFRYSWTVLRRFSGGFMQRWWDPQTDLFVDYLYYLFPENVTVRKDVAKWTGAFFVGSYRFYDMQKELDHTLINWKLCSHHKSLFGEKINGIYGALTENWAVHKSNPRPFNKIYVLCLPNNPHLGARNICYFNYC